MTFNELEIFLDDDVVLLVVYYLCFVHLVISLLDSGYHENTDETFTV